MNLGEKKYSLLKIMTKKLIFTPLKFYSHEDEELFFQWINKIECIESYKGTGKELHLVISSIPISFNDFRNLRGIFKRYNLKNPQQLKELFLTEANKEWFE